MKNNNNNVIELELMRAKTFFTFLISHFDFNLIYFYFSFFIFRMAFLAFG